MKLEKKVEPLHTSLRIGIGELKMELQQKQKQSRQGLADQSSLMQIQIVELTFSRRRISRDLENRAEMCRDQFRYEFFEERSDMRTAESRSDRSFLLLLFGAGERGHLVTVARMLFRFSRQLYSITISLSISLKNQKSICKLWISFLPMSCLRIIAKLIATRTYEAASTFLHHFG